MKSETFADHLRDLIDVLKSRYPAKLLVIQLDNLGSHKSPLVHVLMEK